MLKMIFSEAPGELAFYLPHFHLGTWHVFPLGVVGFCFVLFSTEGLVFAAWVV